MDLLVRGICCLVGGVPGLTENIRVYSIVGRYLEHARIYLFGTEDRRKAYISSADFMTRNTMHRVEVAAPVYDEALKKRVEEIFFDQLRDTAKLRLQQPDGVYVHKTGEGEPFNSQEYFYDQAYSGAWALHSPEKPRKHPKPAVPPEERILSPAPEPAADRPGEKRGLRAWLSRLLGR